ncbi:MAG: hypothetical protein Fur0042_10360 [Cyanophyceae cyanobacterium]
MTEAIVVVTLPPGEALGDALVAALGNRGWPVRRTATLPLEGSILAGATAVIVADPGGEGWELRADRGVERLIDQVSQGVTGALGRVGGLTLFDFRQADPAAADAIARVWGAVDDVVMGGVSDSQLQLGTGAALFSGTVSTANNGGFVSVRTRNFETPLDLTGYQGIELRLRGDGQRYKFIARSQAQWDGMGYSQSFDTVFNTWMTVRLPFRDFVPVFRARTVADAPPLEVAALRSFQLMLSKFEYDGGLNPRFQPGTFSLELETIRAYGGPPRRPLVVLVGDRAETADYLRSSGLPHAVVAAPADATPAALATTVKACLAAIAQGNPQVSQPVP